MLRPAGCVVATTMRMRGNLLSRGATNSCRSFRLVWELLEQVLDHEGHWVSRLLDQKTLHNLNEETIDVFGVEVLLQLCLDICNLRQE